MVEIDKKLVRKRFQKSVDTYNQKAEVQKEVALKLIATLKNTNESKYNKILEIGCGTGFLTREILNTCSVGHYTINDLNENIFSYINEIFKYHNHYNFNFLKGDAEELTFPNQLDLVISSSTIQWFQNPEIFIKGIGKNINPGGYLAISTFGDKNFVELKRTLDIGLQYPSTTKLKNWLSTDYELIFFEEYEKTCVFNSPMDVLKHIKNTGVNGISRRHFGKGDLIDFQKKYHTAYSIKNQGVGLTYHPIIFIAKRK